MDALLLVSSKIVHPSLKAQPGWGAFYDGQRPPSGAREAGARRSGSRGGITGGTNLSRVKEGSCNWAGTVSLAPLQTRWPTTIKASVGNGWTLPSSPPKSNFYFYGRHQGDLSPPAGGAGGGRGFSHASFVLFKRSNQIIDMAVYRLVPEPVQQYCFESKGAGRIR